MKAGICQSLSKRYCGKNSHKIPRILAHNLQPDHMAHPEKIVRHILMTFDVSPAPSVSRTYVSLTAVIVSVWVRQSV